MTRRLKSLFGVLVLSAGCSMILWPGVFTTSASVDASPAPTIDIEGSSATSSEEFLAALGIHQPGTEEPTAETDSAVSTVNPQEDETGAAPDEVEEVADAE